MGKIAIVDYGMGNLHSVKKALEKVAPNEMVSLTRSSSVIDNADRIILPGVGAFGDCIKALRKLNLDKLILRNSNSKPLLAICVGMQILLEFSEESKGTQGLGIIKARVKKFVQNDQRERIKIPHMGWNSVKQSKDHFMWSGIPDNSYFYFVHSYACELIDATHGITSHGKDFSSVLACKNIFAVQFHPEKSQEYGLRIYENFTKWSGEKLC